jgi:hypothetical protein
MTTGNLSSLQSVKRVAERVAVSPHHREASRDAVVVCWIFFFLANNEDNSIQKRDKD